MHIRLTRNRLLATTIICGAAVGFGAAAFAQDAAPVQEVVVTGSLIRSPNITSDSPLTSVQHAEVNLEGTTTIENLINSLPQAIGGQNLGQSIASTGTASASLRGLLPQRTLVLVDGRRLNPGDPSQQAPGADLNMIPSQMVERVDVVTGGASSTYGADAVAGVINFITRKNFQGVEFDVQASGNENDRYNKGFDTVLTQNGYKYPSGVSFDGEQYTASVIMGSNVQDGKGNVTVFASYFHSDPVVAPQRDYSSCAAGSTAFGSNSAVYDGLFCIGSSTSAYGKFIVPGAGSLGIPGTYHDNPTGTNTFTQNGVPGFNFNGTSYIQREDDRYNIGYFAHYEVNKHVELYSDFMFLRDSTTAQYGSSGLFAGETNVPFQANFQVNCNNPFLGTTPGAINTKTGLPAPSQQQALCGAAAGTSALTNVQIGYRFIENGPRVGNFTHDNYRVVLGGRGQLDDVWSYDAYLQYGHVDYEQGIQGYASLRNVANALLVNPNGTCYVGGSCVPLNIFQAQSVGITPAALKYLATPGYQDGNVTEQIADLTLNGDLGKYGLKSPFASDGAQIALGTQYRRENLVFQPDLENETGDLAGGSVITPISGSFDVYELFGEAHIPIVQNLPFVKSITFNPGYRFSDYSSIGTTNTYKLDADWAINDDVRLRYSYNVAVRAPNITELYTPNAELLYASNDPCANDPGKSPSASLAACMNTGVTAAQYGNIPQCPASQCNDIAGGNAALKPETAHTYTFGGVFTPHFIPRLSLSVDYYNIRIENVISPGYGGAATEVVGCLNNAQPTLCNLIHRDPVTGQLYGSGYVTALDLNNGFVQTKGIDVTGNYTLPVGRFGRLAFSFDGTYVQHFVNEPYGPQPGLSGSGTYECAGYFGVACGVPTPHWRSKARVTWNTPIGLQVSAQWRYVGDSKIDENQNNPLLNEGVIDVVDSHIPAISYYDLTLEYKFRGRYTFRAGVNNIFDTPPPVGDANNLGDFGAGNGNTFPQLYDTLGRNMFVGVTADF